MQNTDTASRTRAIAARDLQIGMVDGYTGQRITAVREYTPRGWKSTRIEWTTEDGARYDTVPYNSTLIIDATTTEETAAMLETTTDPSPTTTTEDTMTTTETTVGTFVRGPEVVVELDGTYPNPASKGRAKVTGEIAIVFQGDGEAFAGTSGRAHINDNNRGLYYRDKRFLGSVNAARQADGTWKATHTNVSDRDVWGIDNVARTYVEAIRDALLHEIEQAWTPALEKQATRADLLRSLYHADREERETREKHEQAAAAQADLRTKLAALDA